MISCGGGGGTPQGGGPGGGGPGGQRVNSVEVREVETGAISDQIRAYGTLAAQDVVQVTAQVNERIVRIRADLGDRVSAGQILAELNDNSYREQMNRDRAAMEQARLALVRDSTAFARIEGLSSMNLASPAELDQAAATLAASRAQFRSAVAAYTASFQNLAYTQVRAPVAGYIARRNVAVGDLATGGQPLFELANTGGYELRLFLPMEDWRKTRAGQSVELRLSNAEGASGSGVITRISPQLDPSTGLGEVVISVTGRSADLQPGALVEARINVIQKTGVVVVPRSALVENVQTVIRPESNYITLNRTYSAFISRGDSVAVRRDLQLGIQQGDRIEILSGLEPGDRLVITGQNGLEDGSAIRVSTLPRFNADGSPQQPIGN